MKTLTHNWITEGTIDFEYKKYILLAYLQHVQAWFAERKLYPCLSDIIGHYENLKKLQSNKQFFKDSFQKELKQVDWDKLELKYEDYMESNETLAEIEAIMAYAIPKMEQPLYEGCEIYEHIEEILNIEPIGIMPLNKDVGYIFLQNGQKKDTKVYEYELTIFHKAETPYRSLKTAYVADYTYSISTTYEAMKIDLIKNKKELPNPATFLVETPKVFPLAESFMPVAKRTLVRYLEEK